MIIACTVPSTRHEGRDDGARYLTDPSRWGQVHLDLDGIESGDMSEVDRKGLADTIVDLHRSWLAQDRESFRALLAEDVTRMSFGRLSYGATEVVDTLNYDWEHFERPYGTLAMDLAVQQAELEVRGDTATALYRMDVHAGARWPFLTHAVVFQIFVREGNLWKLTHHEDIWSGKTRTVGVASESAESFDFAYVYPVDDLERAVAFYTPLLGEPETITETRASFNLEGVRFHLDGTALDGYAQIRPGMPNGYAIFRLENLEAPLERLGETGLSIVGGVRRWGPDRYLIGEDPSGNMFMILESVPTRDSTQQIEPRLSVQGGEDIPLEVRSAITDIMTAYLQMKSDAILERVKEDARWIDDTRSNRLAIHEGHEAIERALPRVWNSYDRGPEGLFVEMVIDELSVKPLGERTVVSYRTRLTGRGPHSFRQTALVTQLLEKVSGDWTLGLWFTSSSDITHAIVKELDYTGYPVTRLRKAKRFYSKTLRLGKPYRDVGYWGFWAHRAVFGIYRAVEARDGVPRSHTTNGYVSFWVHSAEEVYQYLKERDSTFPVIEAINNVSGVDPQPGYVQVVATDSEGNLVLFSEYPGN